MREAQGTCDPQSDVQTQVDRDAHLQQRTGKEREISITSWIFHPVSNEIHAHRLDCPRVLRVMSTQRLQNAFDRPPLGRRFALASVGADHSPASCFLIGLFFPYILQNSE